MPACQRWSRLLRRLLLGGIAKLLDLRVAELGVAVEADLRVEHQKLALVGDRKRVDLDLRGIGAGEGLVEQRAERVMDIVEHDTRVRGEPDCLARRVRGGNAHRAVGVVHPDGILWFWIGEHDEYDRIIRGN